MSVVDLLIGIAPVVVIALVVVLFLAKGVYLIAENQVGIVTRKMLGKPMPQGQVIARAGQVGVLADTLVPGIYFRMPIIYSVQKTDVVTIAEDNIGTVESIDGQPLPKGRVVGDEVDCNTFQDATTFLTKGGHKGPQAAILRPGKYRINTRAFIVKAYKAANIDTGNFGVVTALDGVPLPSNMQIAPAVVPIKDHNSFQNPQAFLNGGGYRGPQLDTLQAGLYYTNPLLFDITIYKVYEVPPGSVAVLRSNVGAELVKQATTPSPVGTPEAEITAAPIHDGSEMLVPLTTDKTQRGIIASPLAPGVYNLNPVAYTPYLVPTNAVMIDWADSKTPNQGDFQFGALGVTSQDGFPIAVEVRLVARIEARNAAFIIARFGSVESLIAQIIHPVIDAEFRNNAGSKKALEFVRGRTDLQKEALDKAIAAFKDYNVQAQNLLVSNIRMPQSLMDTQTAKEIALQQQTQYTEQANAEEKRIAVQEMTARAGLQQQVVSAELQVIINENQAKATVKTAEGAKAATILKAEGDKQAAQLAGEGQGAAAAALGSGQGSAAAALGIGQATAVEKVGLATGTAYKAQTEVLTPEMVAAIRIFEAIRDGGVVITPTTLITGGVGEAAGGLSGATTALVAALLTEKNVSKPTGSKPSGAGVA
jgi:uncharacterized membrane protein YqiK